MLIMHFNLTPGIIFRAPRVHTGASPPSRVVTLVLLGCSGHTLLSLRVGPWSLGGFVKCPSWLPGRALSWEIAFWKYARTSGAKFIFGVTLCKLCHHSSDYITLLQLCLQNFTTVQRQLYDCRRESELWKVTLLYCLDHFCLDKDRKSLSVFVFLRHPLRETKQCKHDSVHNPHCVVRKISPVPRQIQNYIKVTWETEAGVPWIWILPGQSTEILSQR